MTSQLEEQKLAAGQRQRTFLLYRSLASQETNSRIVLRNGQTIRAGKLIAVDSSESKFVFDRLTTDWGEFSSPVTVRGSDLAVAEYSFHVSRE
jgi:hypothetical protein